MNSTIIILVACIWLPRKVVFGCCLTTFTKEHSSENEQKMYKKFIFLHLKKSTDLLEFHDLRSDFAQEDILQEKIKSIPFLVPPFVNTKVIVVFFSAVLYLCYFLQVIKETDGSPCMLTLRS